MPAHPILKSAEARAADASRRHLALAELPLFQGLDDAELTEVVTWSTTRHVATGRCVHRRGEAVQALYLVLEGELESLAESADGREARTGVLLPGDVFGEAALLEDRPHRHEVRALTASTVVALPAELLQSFFAEHPSRRLRLRTLAVTRRLAKVSGAFEG